MTTILPSDPIGKSQAILDWCRLHGVNGNTCYKIEADGEWVTFYRYQVRSHWPLTFQVDPMTFMFARAPVTILRQRAPLPTEEQVQEKEQRV